MLSNENPRPAEPNDIAVIGMAGRFPGAENVAEFWRNIAAGRESISQFADDELLAIGESPEHLADPRYVRAGGMLAGANHFDAQFFGISPAEAALTDPQHRLFLECAWEALEDAGIVPSLSDRTIGVYAGSGANGHLISLLARSGALETVDPLQLILGNDKDYLATRVAYKLGLTGSALSVQTACSTSLVAVHLACQALLTYQCDVTLAGGVSISLNHGRGYLFQEGGIASPDGRCRPFDASANGTVGGSGVGIVVLKRLDEALADRDHIKAVIKGSAINNDGASKVSYAAPSEAAQADVIATALAFAGVDPATIDYVEAHGTGTVLGDPIEWAALDRVFREAGVSPGRCAVGSVKSNVGHLDAAAGVAGLIKVILALQHRRLPPSLHFQQPSPHLRTDGSPLYVNTQLVGWPVFDTPGGPA